MKLFNCSVDEFIKYAKEKRIIIYGAGRMLYKLVKYIFTEEILNNIEYIVDKKQCSDTVSIENNTWELCNPSRLREEKDVLILVSSSAYMSQIYEELESMELNDSISVFCLGLMICRTVGKRNTSIEVEVQELAKHPSIPKLIHSFWFSSEKIPENYQRCVDSWEKYCPEYEIKRWTLDNYNGENNEFFISAIEQKKWAFATDIARLDVLYKYGGIYMDMDVELIKPLDELMGVKSFWSFNPAWNIGAEICGSVPGNEFVKYLVSQYDSVSFSIDRQAEFVQPVYLSKSFEKYGIRMNGDMQMIDGNLFLPWNILLTRDYLLFEQYTKTDRSISIHWDNCGWNKKNEGIVMRNKQLESKAIMLKNQT